MIYLLINKQTKNQKANFEFRNPSHSNQFLEEARKIAEKKREETGKERRINFNEVTSIINFNDIINARERLKKTTRSTTQPHHQN